MQQGFEWPIRVYIEDTDAGGIVFYVNYLKYMERARTELFRSLDFGRKSIFNSDLMFVVHSLNSQYLIPAKLDDQLVVITRPLMCGKAYVLLQQDVVRVLVDVSCLDSNKNIEEKRELLCRGEVKIACVERQTIKPRRMPQEMLVALNSML